MGGKKYTLGADIAKKPSGPCQRFTEISQNLPVFIPKLARSGSN